MEAIRSSGREDRIDPLGGAGVHFWQPIIERYGIAATIVNDLVDPTFRFMTADWDGKVRWLLVALCHGAVDRPCATGSTSPSPTTPMPTGTES